MFVSRCALGSCLLLALTSTTGRAATTAGFQPFVPGSGQRVAQVGDKFEDERWSYEPNGRKASHEQDGQQRPPGGYSQNGRWYESAKRGQPDVVRWIATPPGGLPDSRGSLFLCTKISGVPGDPSDEMMQDDLLMGVAGRLGRAVPASWRPSVVVRVYLPEFDRWENRNGSSFGLRADARGKTPEGKVESFWPGMFILFRSETSKQYERDFAQLSVRARTDGSDVPGPKIYEPGWWTFGMSFTPDGAVHYYAHAGVEDLTEDDWLYSSKPYGYECLAIDNIFFNVANRDDGRTWSTPWVIDDPTVYVVPPGGATLADLPRKKSGSAAAEAAQAERSVRRSGGGIATLIESLNRRR
jgi:hypothetical protein